MSEVTTRRPEAMRLFALSNGQNHAAVLAMASRGVATQSDIYSDFIESELRNERDRKAALDTRAASLVTTSGSLITILAAVGAFVGRDTKAPLPTQALLLLTLALIGFAFAVLAGIISGWNRPYRVADTESMRTMIRSRWMDEELLARVEVADVNVRMIDQLRAMNNGKEVYLRAGWISQVVALVLLTGVVMIVLATRIGQQ
jgi:hypothetical protein